MIKGAAEVVKSQQVLKAEAKLVWISSLATSHKMLMIHVETFTLV